MENLEKEMSRTKGCKKENKGVGERTKHQVGKIHPRFKKRSKVEKKTSRSEEDVPIFHFCI